MQDKESANLGILIDLKKKRIRIHRSTLHALGDPDRVHLLVNPEQRMLAVQFALPSDKRAHKVYTTAESNRQTAVKLGIGEWSQTHTEKKLRIFLKNLLTNSTKCGKIIT